MIRTLVVRHLHERPFRTAVLLLGFAAGVGVMIVLLSVGDAMLRQARDIDLVGGGDVTLLPQGIDLEALRTGALRGMFLGIDQASYLQRERIGGPRFADRIAAVSPLIEDKLLYLRLGDSAVPVRAGGEIPSLSRLTNGGLDLVHGTWQDTPSDLQYAFPSPQALYDELDHFHPPAPDASWSEWHYFNVVDGDAWWYITYLVAGSPAHGNWRGQLLLTRHALRGEEERFLAEVDGSAIAFDPTRADLALGASRVRQVDGTYRLTGKARGVGGGSAGEVSFDLHVLPVSHRYVPPLERMEGTFRSGYVVPALRAEATGRICVADRCRVLAQAPAYHDHNWGTWRGVTWEWGMGRGTRHDVLYGGVRNGTEPPGAKPFFLALVDSAGLVQVFRFGGVEITGADPGAAPRRMTVTAGSEGDSLRLEVDILAQRTTPPERGGTTSAAFVQMRGAFTIQARVGGMPVADSGKGFFETFVPRRSPGRRP